MSDTLRDRLAGAWIEDPAAVVARDDEKKRQEEEARLRAEQEQEAERRRLEQSSTIRDQKRTGVQGSAETPAPRPAARDFTSPFIEALEKYSPDNPEAERNMKTQGLLGIREGAPDWAMIPQDLALSFREEIQASRDPVETEYLLNSAYLLSRTQGISLKDAIRDHDFIVQNLYDKAMSPKSAWEAISTTYQAAEVGIRIADLAYKLWEKNLPPEQIEADPLYQQILALEGSMPPMDMIKRNLPVKALKSLAQFLPSMMETMRAGAFQGAMGAGAGAVVGQIYAGTVMNMTGISAVLGGASAVPGLGVVTVPLIALLGYKLASSAGAALRSREIETGSAYYDMLRFRDPITGERINPAVARGFSGVYGGLAGMVEVIQTDAVFDRIFGIGTKARGMLNQAAKETLEDRAAMAARSGVVQRQMLRFLGSNLESVADGTKQVAMETFQETVQEALNIAAEETAKDITNRIDQTDISPATAREVQGRLKEVLVSSALGFSAMYAAPGAIRMFVKGAQATTEGKKAADVYKAEETAASLEMKPEEAEVFLARVKEPLPEGTRLQGREEIEGEQYILKMGDKEGKRVGFVRYTVEPNTEAAEGEAPGTVRIQGMEKGMAPNVAANLIRAVAFRFPGWDVEMETRTPVQEALKRFLISENPRGSEAGLQPFELPRDIPTRVSENYIRQRIRDVATGWKDDEIEVSSKWIRAWARMMGMTGDELADKVFDPRVFGRNITPEMAAQGVTGSATMVRFGDQIRTLIDMSRNANPSTFMHETTHAVVFFAQANRSADPRVGQFLQELEAALGVEGGNWDAEFKGWTEEYKYKNRSNYEALAYALEDYFLTGKAPRPGLEGLFQRMAEWVAAVVKGLTGARVDLSPDLRAYFDKLVADPASPFSEAYNGETEETIQADLAEQPKGETPEDEELLEIYQGPAQAVGREKLRELAQTRLRGTAEGRGEEKTGWSQRAGRWYRQGPAPRSQENTPEAQATIEEAGARMTPQVTRNPAGLYEELKAYEDRPEPEEPTQEDKALFQGDWTYRSEDVAMEKIRGALPGRQILATMRGAGVKEDEIHWLGLDEYLDTDEKIAPQALQEFIAGNKLDIKEELGTGNYGQYTLPGGENYRELLFVLPRLDQIPTRMVPRHEFAQAKSAEILDQIMAINEEIGNAHLKKVFDVQDPSGNPNAGQYGIETREMAERIRDMNWPEATITERYMNPGERASFLGMLHIERDRLENEDRKNYEEVPVPLSEIPTWRRPEKPYRSGHFHFENILAHVRTKERTDPDGYRMTFIEEIQSDWHQAGRERGYVRREKVELEEMMAFDGFQSIADDGTVVFTDGSSVRYANRAAAEAEVRRVWYENHIEEDLVPDAPFKKTWHEFVLKRMIRAAVERGQKYIGWTTGQQQADRYNLASYVKEIEYEKTTGGGWIIVDDVGNDYKTFPSKNQAIEYAKEYGYEVNKIKESSQKAEEAFMLSIVTRDGDDKAMGPYTAEELPGVVGKEVAQKILNGEGKKYRGHEGRTLEGLDLVVGGEGMRNFYDRDLVNFANKLGKPYGAQVEKQSLGNFGNWILVDYGTGVSDGQQIGQENFNTQAEAEQFAENKGISYYKATQLPVDYHALPITEGLADRAMKGFPLFQGDPGKIHDVAEGDAMGAIERLLDAKEGQVKRAVYRPETGWIDFYWGIPGDPMMDWQGGFGVSHILDKHEDKDHVLDMIPQILRYGTVVEQRGATDRLAFIYKGYRAIVRLDWGGKPQAWLVTAYLWRDRETGEPLYKGKPFKPDTGSFDRNNVKGPDLGLPKGDRRLYQGEWTYKSESVVSDKIRGALPGKQILATLRGAGVKEEEIKWTGLDEFLNTDEKKTAQDVLQHISANRLQIQEKTGVEALEGHVPAEYFEARYPKYTLPGGENYREVLFKLPERVKEETPREIGIRLFGDDRFIYDRTPEQLSAIWREMMRQEAGQPDHYLGPHWGQEQDVLAHTRINERTTTDGRAVLFVEEIQSDWHQQGREKGYKPPLVLAGQVTVENREGFTWKVTAPDGRTVIIPRGQAQDEEGARYYAEGYFNHSKTGTGEGVADAPFKKTWHEFVFKRMVQEAARMGKDAIAWTTGKQQADRYNLANQVDRIIYKKNEDGSFRVSAIQGGRGIPLGDSMTPEAMAGAVGKDIANRVIAGEGEETEVQGDTKKWKSLSGVQLTVGGEGMANFYDRDLVNYANKLGKPHGAQVVELKLKGLFKIEGPGSEKKASGVEVHALPLTAGLRDQALKGFSLFQGEVFHGAKAPFEEFDHSYMGSGEGAQVYGWGTYISENTGVARKGYAEKLGSTPEINWNGLDSGQALRAYRENYLGVREIDPRAIPAMKKVLDAIEEEIKPALSIAGLIPASKAAADNNGTWKLKALIRSILPRAIDRVRYEYILTPEYAIWGGMTEEEIESTLAEAERFVQETTEPATLVYIQGGHWFYHLNLETRGKPRTADKTNLVGPGSLLFTAIAGDDPIRKNILEASAELIGKDVKQLKEEYGFTPHHRIIKDADAAGQPVGSFIESAVLNEIFQEGSGRTGVDLLDWLEELMGNGLAHTIIRKAHAEEILEPHLPIDKQALKEGRAEIWSPVGYWDHELISEISGIDFYEDDIQKVLADAANMIISKPDTYIPAVTWEDIDDWSVEGGDSWDREALTPKMKEHVEAFTAAMENAFMELAASFYDPNTEAKYIDLMPYLMDYTGGPEGDPPLFFLVLTGKGMAADEQLKKDIKAKGEAGVYDDAEGRWIRWDKLVDPEDIHMIEEMAGKIRDWMQPPHSDENFDKIVEIFGQDTWEAMDVTDEVFDDIAMGIHNMLDYQEFEDGAGEPATGKALYKYLQEQLDGSAEAVSKFLLAAGFDGIRMPVNYLRGGQGDQGFNRVVFNDKAIKIKKRILFQGDGADSILPSQAGGDPEPGSATIHDVARSFADDGKTWEEFAEFMDVPFMEEERTRWDVPDLPEKDRLAWYKAIFEEANSDARKGAELGKWLSGLAENGHERLKDFLRAVWTEVVLISESEPEPGATEEDAKAWQETRAQAEQFREQIAEPIIAGALAIGAKRSTVSQQFMGSLFGIIRANPEEYAYIAGTIMGDAKVAELGRQAAEEKYQDIEDPKLKEGMGIARRAALAAQIREERLAARIRTGAVVDQDIEDYIKKLRAREEQGKQEQEAGAKEMAGLEAQLDARAKQIADARRARTENLAEIKKLQRRLQEYLDNNEPVPKSLESQRERLEKRRDAIQQKLTEAGDWAELEQQLRNEERREAAAQARIDEAHARGEAVERSDIEARSRAHQAAATLRARLAEVREYRDSAQLQTYLAKLEAKTKAEDIAAERAAEKKALQEVRTRRKRLVASIMRKPGEGIYVKQAKAINKIRAAINPANVSAKTLEAVRGLRDELEKNPDIAREIPKTWLNRALKTNASEMSLRDLEETERVVTELRRNGRAELQNRRQALRDAREDAQIAVAEIMIGLPGYKPPKAPDQETLLDKLQGKFREFDYAFKNMRRFARDMDGGKDGINVQLLSHQVNEAYRKERIEIARRRKAILDGLEKRGIRPDDWFNEEIQIAGAGPGRSTVTLRKSALLLMELGFRDEDSRAAILFGDFFSQREKQSMDEEELLFEGAHRFAILRQAIDDHMTAADLEALNEVFAADAKETAPRLGETVAEVENREFVEVENYIPLIREGVTGTPIDVQLAEDITSRTPGLRKPPRNGFTKARVKISPKHQGRVKLDLLGLWMESIERQEHYIATARLGKELDSVYLSPYVQEQIQGAFGSAGVDYVKEYIAEVKNPGSLRNVNRWENSIRYLRGNLGIAYLSFRISSVLKQVITSPWPALPYAGPQLFVEIMKMMANPMKYLQDTEALSVVLQNRTMDQIMEAIKEAEAGTPLGKAMLKVGQVGTKGLEYADRFSVAAGWRAVYEKALEEFKGDHDQAVRKADDVILMTQPSSRGIDLAPIYRRGGEATRLLLQFTMALNVIYQNIRYDLPNAIKNHQYGTAIGTVIGYAMAGILLNAATRGLPDDEEDWGKTITFWSLTQATDALPLIGQDATRLLNRVVTGQKEPQFPDTALPGVSKMIEGMYKLTDGDIERGLQQFAVGSGMILGVPTSGFTEVGRFVAGDPGAIIGRTRKD